MKRFGKPGESRGFRALGCKTNSRGADTPSTGRRPEKSPEFVILERLN
jgi:hypothetical protein